MHVALPSSLKTSLTPAAPIARRIASAVAGIRFPPRSSNLTVDSPTRARAANAYCDHPHTEDQKLLALMVKRVGVALRLQRNNGIVRSASGPGQYMLWEIAH